MIPISKLPSKPGCYLYYSQNNKVIYVGKAKNLQKRVKQYFQRNIDNQKTKELVKRIHNIDYVVTDSEVEALLLESRLIKQYKPKYNLDLKENERYAYIQITDETYPRLITARRKTSRGEYFGPFISSYNRVLTIKTLNRVFELMTCKKSCTQKPGLQNQIGLCSCPYLQNISQEEYASRIKRVKQVLKGDTISLKEQLRKEMKQFASQKQFEYAKLRRDQLEAIESLEESQKVDASKEFDQDIIGVSINEDTCCYFIFTVVKGIMQQKETVEITQTVDDQKTLNQQFLVQYYEKRIPPKQICVSQDFCDEHDMTLIQEVLSKKTPYTVSIHVPKRGDLLKLVHLATKNADYALAKENPVLVEVKELLTLPQLPVNIECYDISNLKNQYIVGAKIHFQNAQPCKSLYRKYKIRSIDIQNDFAAMYEVLYRRLKRHTQEMLPQLIVIDGGKGQLQMALKAAKDVGVSVPMIGLAKKDEEIYFPGLSKPLKTQGLTSKHAGVKLLIRIRDETHRFVIAYHRKLRETIL